MSRLGDRLRTLMQQKGVSAARLAQAGGIDESTMQAILSGGIERPPDRRLRGFAERLGVSFDSLLQLIPEDKRETAAIFDQAVCAIAVAGDAPDWIQLMPLGEVRPKDGRGPWTLSNPKAVIDASKAGLDKLPIDYDHQIDYAQQTGNAAPAAGWIEEMEVRDDGIYARVEWTEKGAAAIAAKEYRFISPAFAVNKKTGEITKILRAGLTNDPALFLKALANRQANAEEEDMDKLLKQLRQLLGLAEDADEAAVCSAVKEAAEKAKTAAGTADLIEALGLKPDAAQDKICAAVKKAAAEAKSDGEVVLTGIAKALGLEADASADEVETAAAKATAAAAKAGDRDQLATRLAKLEDDNATEKATAAVDGAIKAGKIVPAQRDWAIERAKKDPKDFETFLASQPVIVAPGAKLPGGKTPKGGDGMTADELALCKRHGLKPEEYKKARDEDREEEIA